MVEILDVRLLQDLGIFITLMIMVQTSRMTYNLYLGIKQWREPDIEQAMFWVFLFITGRTAWLFLTMILFSFPVWTLVTYVLGSVALAWSMTMLFEVLRESSNDETQHQKTGPKPPRRPR